MQMQIGELEMVLQETKMHNEQLELELNAMAENTKEDQIQRQEEQVDLQNETSKYEKQIQELKQLLSETGEEYDRMLSQAGQEQEDLKLQLDKKQDEY